jgi:hypothetical protein
MSLCAICKTEITQRYYTVGSNWVCLTCGGKVYAIERQNKGKYLRNGILAAVGSGVLASLLMWGAQELASLSGGSLFSAGAFFRGAATLIVGRIVGGATRIASKGRGSLGLKVAAGLCTYLALVGALVFFLLERLPVGKLNPQHVLGIVLVGPFIPFILVIKSPIAITGLVVDGMAVILAVSENAKKAIEIQGPFELAHNSPGQDISKARPMFSGYEV